MTVWLVALAALTCGAAGFIAGRRIRHTSPPSAQPLPADHEHVLDLLRRAHRAIVAVLVREDGTIVSSTHPRGVPPAITERGLATARLALANSHAEQLTAAPATVASPDGEVAVGLVFDGEIGEDAAERALADAWRLAAALAEARERERSAPRTTRWSGESWIEIPETADAAASSLCEALRHRTGRPTALVLRDEVTGALRVARVSAGADQRLVGTSALPASAVARAVQGETPVAGTSVGELLGHPQLDRRRAELQGLVLPIVDGRNAVGALVLFGPPAGILPETRDEAQRLLFAAGPRLAHLQALHVREKKAQTDELTGLPNRRGLDRAMQFWSGSEAALLILDLDFFKRVNDTFGHVAGDAALRHLAAVVRRALRVPDLAARIGGEEFALWLPDTPLRAATDVAERVRAAVQATPVRWSGREIPLTCSIGVAALPETTAVADNLYPQADAALYRAKQAGRNRVEVSGPAPRATQR